MPIFNSVYWWWGWTPTPSYRTFTISWTETSNPAQFNPVYSDDATWLTAGSTDFDDFFGYSGVRLSTAGVETAVQPQSAGVLDITQLWTLTSGDNVMIKFPVRWIKMSKSWSTVTLSITDGVGREDEWYQYYAFQDTWNIVDNANTTVATKPFYLGAYLSYNDSNTLKSWSGKTPSANLTHWNAITYASNNWTWYTIMWFYQRMYLTALYMMKYWNPDSQTVVWKWYVGWSAAATTWWSNGQTSATYWTTSTTTHCKLFWIEDAWGNLYQWIWWCFTDGSKNLWTALHSFTANVSTSESQYKNTGIVSWWADRCMSSTSWDNKWMFIATGDVSNSSMNTYYCDVSYSAANRLTRCWWAWDYWNWAGIFQNTYFAYTSSNSVSNNQWARIMYL